MIRNLNVNTKEFKKKMKYMTLALVMSSTVLSGCSVVKEDVSDDNKENTVETDSYNLKITLNLNDYESLASPDLLIFYDDDNNIYNATDGDSKVKIVNIEPLCLDNLNIVSEALDTSIDLPSIDEDETYEVNIDYATKTYSVDVIDKQLDKGKNK